MFETVSLTYPLLVSEIGSTSRHSQRRTHEHFYIRSATSDALRSKCRELPWNRREVWRGDVVETDAKCRIEGGSMYVCTVVFIFQRALARHYGQGARGRCRVGRGK